MLPRRPRWRSWRNQRRRVVAEHPRARSRRWWGYADRSGAGGGRPRAGMRWSAVSAWRCSQTSPSGPDIGTTGSPRSRRPRITAITWRLAVAFCPGTQVGSRSSRARSWSSVRSGEGPRPRARAARRQAGERDEEATARWVAHEWPRIKRGARNIGLDSRLRRVGQLVAAGHPPDMVAQGQGGLAVADGLAAGVCSRAPTVAPSVRRRPAGSARRREPTAAVAVSGWAVGKLRRTVVAWGADRAARGRPRGPGPRPGSRG
jgi:hypothetical protein